MCTGCGVYTWSVLPAHALLSRTTHTHTVTGRPACGLDADAVVRRTSARNMAAIQLGARRRRKKWRVRCDGALVGGRGWCPCHWRVDDTTSYKRGPGVTASTPSFLLPSLSLLQHVTRPPRARSLLTHTPSPGNWGTAASSPAAAAAASSASWCWWWVPQHGYSRKRPATTVTCDPVSWAVRITRQIHTLLVLLVHL